MNDDDAVIVAAYRPLTESWQLEQRLSFQRDFLKRSIAFSWAVIACAKTIRKNPELWQANGKCYFLDSRV